MSFSLMDLYNVFSNVFQLKIDVANVYEIPYNPNEEFDRAKFVRDGSFLYSASWVSGANTKLPSKLVTLKLINQGLRKSLMEKGYFYKGEKQKKKYYKADDEINHYNKNIFKLYSGFVYNLPIIQDEICICINHTVVLHCIANLFQLRSYGVPDSLLSGIKIRYNTQEKKNLKGFLLKVEGNNAVIKDKMSKSVINIPLENTYPEARVEEVQAFLNSMGKKDDVIGLMRRNSFLTSKTASTDRATAIFEIVKKLKNGGIFPLKIGEIKVDINDEPVFVKV